MQTMVKCSADNVKMLVEKHNGEILESTPGKIIENVVYCLDCGILFCFEHSINEEESDYTLYYFPGKNHRGINSKWKEFYNRKYSG